MHSSRLLGAAAAVLGFAFIGTAQESKVRYPETKKVEHVDDYHGTKVPDPYRWLEDDVRTSKDVADWVEAENKVTNAYLEGIPERAYIKQRITDLFNFEKYSAPSKHGGKYFYSKNDGLQNQSVLYVQDTPMGEPRLLLDPNKLSKDGTVALSGFEVSDDGKHVAYGLAEAGSDWNTWKVLDVATGKTLDDELKWVKFSSAAWTKDAKGFYYSRFPEPAKGAAFQSLNVDQKLYFHKLGTPQAEDTLVYELPAHPTWNISAGVTDDGKYLVIYVSDGTTSRKTKVLFQSLENPAAKPVALIDNQENKWGLIDNIDSVFYFQTDWQAPKYQIVAIDTKNPDPKVWKTVLPESADVIQSATLVGGKFAVSYLKDAKTVVKIHDVDGKFFRDVALPGIGSAGGFGGKARDPETFYTFASFTTPPSIFRYDMSTGESKLLRQAKVKFSPADYEVKQVFYPSKDGTKIPMFIAHKKGIPMDGTNPVLLYGYGGFNISLPPSFSTSRVQWMEMGGVLAVANLRGGGEYGDAWHRAGTKLTKQNVFDDFIGAAEYLIKEKYTSPKKIGIQGGSNGGLLVGACMTQRPDLFGACLPAVGVMDMLRFQNFTAGRFWVDDYGSSADPEQFKALYAYSPYHNLKPGTKYPATLVTTADTDDRVVPGHSFKFIAKLQYSQSGDAPVLARIETKAGHGAGKPTTKVIEETADQWAFLVKNLGVKVVEVK
ncbi:prolyl oligopeptidase family serine peptidase [Limnoglobus roseus]|uniref:prolyl oligopeptidase n=1 Tax=Limnoglobus roseus TaxID=2598579 RepID=A0A5C1AA68_9BACT|nr:prolyl oligopeptidase family serine peptidase [Limnoglobus roseus]QEL16101.1 S9 family peptidase [Limnoglobus roseus]